MPDSLDPHLAPHPQSSPDGLDLVMELHPATDPLERDAAEWVIFDRCLSALERAVGSTGERP